MQPISLGIVVVGVLTPFVALTLLASPFLWSLVGR
jgi:hypothetical protein